MSNLMNLFRLTQDAANSAKNGTRIAIENMVGSKDPKFIKRTSTMNVEVVGGQISGLTNTAPQRVVDDKIVAAIRNESSRLQYDSIKKEYLELFDDLNGSLDKSTSMDKLLIKLSDQAALLTAEAGSPVLRRGFIESAKSFLTSINGIAKGIDDQRNSVERSLIASVEELNLLTSQLFELNRNVIEANYNNQDSTALEDKRDDVIRRISSLTDIQVVESEKNLFVYTSTGKPLVEHKLYPLSYTSSGVIDYSASYPDNINGVKLLQDNGSLVDITLEFSKGKIGALLALRDRTYPDYQKALDHFAKTFQEQMNKVHNKGVGFPPPETLEGKAFIENGAQHTPIDWKKDSVVRIAIVDGFGKFADPGSGTFYVDLNLNSGGVSGLSAVDIRNQINGAFGLDIVSFSEGLDEYGRLSFSAPEGFRVAIGSVDSQVIGETDSGVGFSEYFQLNNLIDISADNNGNGYANSIKLSAHVASDASFLALGKLNSAVDIALTGTVDQTTAVAAGDVANLVNLRGLINNPVVSFNAAGVMSSQSTSFLGWLSGYVNLMHLDAVSASQQEEFSKTIVESLELRHAMISGVNEDEESGEVMMNKLFYRSIIDTSKQLIEMLHSLLELIEQH